MTERSTDLFAAVAADMAAKKKAADEREPSPIERELNERGARLRAFHQAQKGGTNAAA